MGRTFKTRNFCRWMRKTDLTGQSLCSAVDEMERGLINADLGSGVVKKRISLPGRGKSGGARALVVTNKSDRWFFVFGFEKNKRDSISPNELKALKLLATDLLKLSLGELDAHVKNEALQEICHDRKN